MKLRARPGGDGDAFDGLTAEDVRRIRGGAAASVTPGLEALALEPTQAGTTRRSREALARHLAEGGATPYLDITKRKRGRRA